MFMLFKGNILIPLHSYLHSKKESRQKIDEVSPTVMNPDVAAGAESLWCQASSHPLAGDCS